MPLIAKGSGARDFTPAPKGTFRAVCVDVVDLGEIEETWEGKSKKSHKVRIVWQVDELMEDGRPFVVAQRYTLSFNERANLRAMVEQWFATSFTPEQESEGFDVETLIGQSCIVTVVHRTSAKGLTFANVGGVAPLMKGMPPLLGRDYKRVKDRDVTAKSSGPADPGEWDELNPPPATDADALPF